ncbi:hypothetical protein ACOCEA_09725 [Maribacter sp. CXY002]
MKNKRTFLASIALGIFLLATVAPIISVNDDVNGVKRSEVKPSGRA